MFLSFLNIIKSMLFFTGSYSNNVFLEPLTPEEEDKYVKLMLEGNTSARNKLIEHNLRLVAHIVKKYTKEMIILSSQTGRIDTLEKISNIDIPKNYRKYQKSIFCTRRLLKDQ